MSWSLKELRRSSTDKVVAGICGGFGAYTPVPAWMWRAAFIAAVLLGGFGILIYLILWACMPSAQHAHPGMPEIRD